MKGTRMRITLLALAVLLVGATRPVAVVHHTISQTAAAQAAFDRGMVDYYAYNPEAAEHEFYAASDLDRDAAMAWWGIALSNAPNLNVPANDDRDAKAREAIQRAKALEGSAPAEDRALIDAAGARFDGAGDAKADTLQVAYRDALAKIALAYPNDPDVAALHAEAALYVAVGDGPPATADRRAAMRSATAATLPLFQAYLTRFPQHIGLLHFYIHAAQFAGKSALAVDAATKLAAFGFRPEDSHLTHMPGHIFFDVGMYDQGLDVGRRSVAMDFADYACCHPGYYAGTRYYHDHNVSFLLYALTELGRTKEAVTVAQREMDPDEIARQLLADEQWNAILLLPHRAGTDATVAFARGIAFAHLGDVAQAQSALAEMPAAPFAATPHGATSEAMRRMLVAAIAVAKGDDATALDELSQASTLANTARITGGGEMPALYYYSPNLALADLAARIGKRDVALTAYRAELTVSPGSPAAVRGIAALRR